MLGWLRCFPHNGAAIDDDDKEDNATDVDNNTMKPRPRPLRTASSSSFSWRKKMSSSSSDAETRAPAPGRITRTSSTLTAPTHAAAPQPPRAMTMAAANHSVLSARAFSFADLAAATDDFGQDNLIGQGGFGRVYKGRLRMHGGDGGEMAVAVKRLDRTGFQGDREFLVEVLVLSGLLDHPNLVALLGFCADAHHRLLVYRLIPLGSLEDHLHNPGHGHPVLPWRARMRVAHGVARGLEHLHDTASPPIIYRDLKPSNVLLDDGYEPRLSDFGLAKLLPSSSCSDDRVMGSYGYCAPEYARKGHLTVKSDVYSFGVVLLEIITGRRAIDAARPDGEQSLVGWAAPLLQAGRLRELLDPRLLLLGQQPVADWELKQSVAVASMCLQEQHSLRPVMADVVLALAFLAGDN